MSVHLLVSDARFRCGKRPAYNLAHTDNINEVTCKTCIEAHLFNNGKIREYRLGGRFEKGVTPRRHESHWSYRKENKAMGEKIKELEAKIKLQDQRIENLLKAVEFYSNISTTMQTETALLVRDGFEGDFYPIQLKAAEALTRDKNQVRSKQRGEVR